MKIHQINGHIQQIYLAEYPDKLLLLDGGSRSDVSKIVGFIQKTLGRSMSELKLSVVSHMHPDHCSAAPILRKKYGVPIAAGEYTDNWYNGVRGFTQHLLDVLMTWLVVLRTKKQLRTVWHPRKIKADFKLTDHEPLPFFNDWQAIYAPGHTAHDIMVLNNSHSTLYCADNILRIRKKFLLPFPIPLPKLMQNTVQKLAALNAETLLMAHGGIAKNISLRQISNNLAEQLNHQLPNTFRLMKPLTKFSKCVKQHGGN